MIDTERHRQLRPRPAGATRVAALVLAAALVLLAATVAACGGGVSGEVEPAGLALPDRSTTEGAVEEVTVGDGPRRRWLIRCEPT